MIKRRKSESMIIDFLRQEHRNVEKLLRVLEKELNVFDRGERPDYEVIRMARDAAENNKRKSWEMELEQTEGALAVRAGRQSKN